MKVLRSFLTIALLILFFACNKDQDVVVVYTSVDQVFSEPILKEFEQKTGIKVKAIYDTEETKSTGVLNRLIAEKNNPQCDVFWSGDPVRVVVLKQKGITTQYRSPAASDIPAIYKDPDGQWTGFSARARVLIYNKSLMDSAQVPKSIFDLVKPEYRGKVAIANPLFGTTTFHVAAIFSVLGDDSARAYFDALKANDVVIATSNGDVKKRVASGEIACGLTDTDDAHEAIKQGDNVGVVFLDQDNGFGTLIMPNTVCLIKDSPHPDNGKRLIDFLLSRHVEEELAVSAAQMPLHKGVPVPDGVPSLDNIVPMHVDYNKVAQKLEQIQPWIKQWAE